MTTQATKTRVYALTLLREWDPVLTANGSALPLGCLMSYAKAHKAGTLTEFFDFRPLKNCMPTEWHYYPDEAAAHRGSIWLVSSYVWNHEDNLEIARQIKEADPTAMIIAGGPHIPAYEAECQAFLQTHPYIDITSRGEGEVTLAEILERVAEVRRAGCEIELSGVNGITYRKGGQLQRNPDRIKTRDLDKFPSPYLTGEFEDASFDDLPLMILETNRGCPFGCTFCDWGSATLQKFSLFDLDRVKQEIVLIAKKRIESLYLGDSNFGAFDRDIEIAQAIADAKRKYGYPKQFGTSFAKNASPRLAKIIKILSQEKLIHIGLISIQSTDKETLDAINRSNIKNEKYEKLIEIFKQEKLNLSSELLIGLPGQTVQSHKEDLQFFIDRKLMTIAYCTAVMPNAPMNEPGYRKKYQIVTDKNGYVMSTSTFSNEERKQMIKLFLSFQFFYGAGVLRYFLYHLQMEHSIRFMDFVESYLNFSAEHRATYPISYQLQNDLLSMRREWSPSLEWTPDEGIFLFCHLEEFYAEVVGFTKEHYKLNLSADIEKTLVDAQIAVMPSLGKTVPFSVALPHDLPAYIQQIKELPVADHRPDNFRPLSSFPATVMKVSALKNKTIDSVGLVKFDRWTGAGFELRSPLRFHH